MGSQHPSPLKQLLGGYVHGICLEVLGQVLQVQIYGYLSYINSSVLRLLRAQGPYFCQRVGSIMASI